MTTTAEESAAVATMLGFEVNRNFKFHVHSKDRPPLHKGTKCDIRFKSSLNSARLNLLNPYK